MVAEAHGSTLQRLKARIRSSPIDPEGSQKHSCQVWNKRNKMRYTVHSSVCKLKHIQTKSNTHFTEIYTKNRYTFNMLERLTF